MNVRHFPSSVAGSSEALDANSQANMAFRYPDCPVERLVRSRVHLFQHSFAIEAERELDGQFADVVCVPSRKGLQLLAHNELALQLPVDALASLYPEKLDLGITRVRYRTDDAVQEPMMTVLLRVPYVHYAAVRLDLAGRDARCVKAELLSRAAIVCAEVRQAELLGYPEWLARTTEGTANVCLRLSHYAPVAPAFGPEPA